MIEVNNQAMMEGLYVNTDWTSESNKNFNLLLLALFGVAVIGVIALHYYSEVGDIKRNNGVFIQGRYYPPTTKP